MAYTTDSMRTRESCLAELRAMAELRDTFEELESIAEERENYLRRIGVRPEHAESYIRTLCAQLRRLTDKYERTALPLTQQARNESDDGSQGKSDLARKLAEEQGLTVVHVPMSDGRTK